jgi:transposase
MDVLLQKDDHLLMELGNGVSQLEVIKGPIGRRHWPNALKAQLVAESFEEGVLVCDVARRNGLNPRQLSSWRKMAREGKLAPKLDDGPAFAALVVDESGGSVPANFSSARVEIEVCGVIVRLAADSCVKRIAAVASALRLA